MRPTQGSRVPLPRCSQARHERRHPLQGQPLVYVLVAGALALLVAIYFLPVWWVSLTAPNYPPEAFPEGVRIHFHMNGVFNGCQKVAKAEISETEALDCVHEMDTINHYVGMYPIAAGGVIERAFSPFLITMLGIMLVGFMIPAPQAAPGGHGRRLRRPRRVDVPVLLRSRGHQVPERRISGGHGHLHGPVRR